MDKAWQQTDDRWDDEEARCRVCGGPLDEAGDGWDGQCPDCSDKAEARFNQDDFLMGEFDDRQTGGE